MILNQIVQRKMSPKSKVKSRQKAKRSGNGLKFNIKGSHDKYLNDIFVIDDLNAWSPLLRSKTAIRTSSNIILLIH